METLEHLPSAVLDIYLTKLAASTGQRAFFSFPNEQGLVFFLKYFFKSFFLKQREPYTAKEIFYATIGKTHKVQRTETGHKGFGYKKLIHQINRHFDVEQVQGLPIRWLPASLSFTVCVIARPKKK
jgi:hypothetical protein